MSELVVVGFDGTEEADRVLLKLAYIFHDNFLLIPPPLILQQKGELIYRRLKFRIAATGFAGSWKCLAL